MNYNPDLHHRKSIRLKGFDYSKNGAYFITICTWNHKCLFGKIVSRGTMHRAPTEMSLSEYGNIVKSEWLKTEEIRSKIVLDKYVIMPNHIHGIIIIDNADCRGTMHRAPTVEQFGKPTSNTIPTIIRGYKSAVTKQINELRNTPSQSVWQRNYYEHIIRNDEELNHIREYILDNPTNWETDENNNAKRKNINEKN